MMLTPLVYDVVQVVGDDEGAVPMDGVGVSRIDETGTAVGGDSVLTRPHTT